MQADYAPFIDRVIKNYEGPYGWDKGDPGGPTKYGITCYDLAEHRGEAMTSMAEWAPIVKAMGLAEAEAIYRTKYAARLAFDSLNAGCDCVVLDYGINSGIGRVIRVTRHLVGKPGSETRFDAELIAAVNATDPHAFIKAMDQERLSFMHAIRGGASWKRFGGGWQHRVDDLTVYSDHLAAGGAHATAPKAPDLSHVITPKATNPAPKSTTAGSVIASAPSSAAVHAAGLPWQGVATVAIGVIALGVGYEIWQAIRANKANQLVHA